jgi:hypothetical protein
LASTPASSEAEALGSDLEVGDLIPDRALTLNDRDEFDYEPIAERIADLCCVAEAPVNVALFSPWGSGKSSFFTLIRSRLAGRDERVKLIRYDAWRYGGEALPRNFIAHAARELHLPLDDARYTEFHRGLYENQRQVKLSPLRFWAAIRNARFAPFLLLALVVLLVAALLGLSGVVIAALVSIVALFLAAVIDAGKVVVEQSRPSEDEEFSRRFERLVEWATDSRRERSGGRQEVRRAGGRLRGYFAHNIRFYRLAYWWHGRLPLGRLETPAVERLVFFIDELDRCDEEDIVATLKALRTFLDAKHCVFIVAADRQAIEQALSKVEQSTPVDPERPYYSTASAYLDKIFQHQITLPPLRSRSLAKFARSLTIKAGGIWAELVEAGREEGGSEGEATPLLDLVLFTLIPSHVRSPRRVKVLLNNYATNARIVRSRLPDVWPKRARQIARLTTFQTEFPDFAADLALEPRLPRFLLDASDAPESELVDQALSRWNLSPDEEDAEVENPDSTLPLGEGTPEDEPAHLQQKRKRLERRRREELRRYLERTDDVEDLRRDLFYLQPAGLDVGLRDSPELAELIEVEATDSPDTVVEALRGRGAADLAGAARLLASMVDDVLGPEQKQVMTALMEVAAMLGDGAARVSTEVAGALRTYWTGRGELEERHLVGALRTALTVRLTNPRLVRRLINDRRLWDDAERVAAVIPMCGQLRDGEEIEALRTAIAAHLPEEWLVLLEAIDRLELEQRLRLMDNGAIFAAIGEAIDRAEQEEASEEEAE